MLIISFSQLLLLLLLFIIIIIIIIIFIKNNIKWRKHSETVISRNLSDNRKIKIHVYAKRVNLYHVIKFPP